MALDPGTDGKRLAALALHALTAPDRAWLLEQLPAPQRVELEDLMGELVALRIPRDPELLNAAMANSSASDLGMAPVPVAPAPWSDPAVVAVLQSEPLGLVARYLAELPAPQQDALLLHWPPSDAQSIRQLLSRKPAPDLQRAVAHMVHALVRADWVRLTDKDLRT